jgi:hypothetical protein
MACKRREEEALIEGRVRREKGTREERREGVGL